MSTQLLALAGAIAVVLALFGIVFLLGMRAKSPLVLGPVIALSKAVINPKQMRTAGTPGAYASIIRHRGRTTGRPYETPVGAVATDDGFVIALPYGTRAQWLRNVFASGSATLVTEGCTYEVDRPELLPMAAAEPFFSASDMRSHRLFAVDHCLRLRRVGQIDPATQPTGPGEFALPSSHGAWRAIRRLRVDAAPDDRAPTRTGRANAPGRRVVGLVQSASCSRSCSPAPTERRPAGRTSTGWRCEPRRSASTPSGRRTSSCGASTTARHAASGRVSRWPAPWRP
jgi:deazaflavin-dependent oxidoreductase (nitroreductase family)